MTELLSQATGMPCMTETAQRIETFNLKPGRVIAGKYLVERRLGGGWEGEVYKVIEQRTGAHRAAKLFKPEEIGKAVYFAYAVPYTYTDLLRDLDAAKGTLCALAGEGSASPGFRVIESPPKESAAPSSNGPGAPDVSPTAQPGRTAPAMSAAQVWRSTVAKKKSAIDMYHE